MRSENHIKYFSLILLVLCACLAAACQKRDLHESPAPFSFVQLTDIHIAPGGARVKGVDTVANFERAVKEVNSIEPAPAFVVITGDLAAYKGDERAYRKLEEIAVKFKPPVFYALGNHDSRPAFRNVILKDKIYSDSPYYYSFSKDKFLFVILDSWTKTARGRGFGKKQLDWLRAELSRNSGQTCFVFVHHHLFKQSRLNIKMASDRNALLGVLKDYPNVRYVVNGHIHFASILKQAGKYFISTMAVSYGFEPGAGAAGYRIFEISAGGDVKTFDKRLGLPAVLNSWPEE